MKTTKQLQKEMNEIKATLRVHAWSNYYPLQMQLKKIQSQLHVAKMNEIK